MQWGNYKRFIWAGVVLIAILLIGSVGYWIIGGRQHSVIDALYMTFITISTIGFGEIVDMSGAPGGRVFTMFIAAAGIGLIAYIATSITALIIEGELTKSFRRSRMEKAARNSRDHYIICGLGNIGVHIMNELASTGRPFVIVDKYTEQAEKESPEMKNQTVIEGDATEDAVLKKAGIDDAKGLFAVTGDDNQNLVISLTAKQLNPRVKVISRCESIANMQKMHKAGADRVISPNHIGGLRMASEMVRPTVVSFLDVMLRDQEKNLRVEEITTPEAYVGKSVKSLSLKNHPDLLLMAIKTGADWVYNPQDDYVIRKDSTLIFMATDKARRELESIAGGNG